MRILLWAALPLLAFLLYRRTVRPAATGFWRWAWTALVAAGLASPVVPKLWGGSTVAPLMPVPALLVTEFLLFMLLFMAGWTVVREAAGFILERLKVISREALSRSKRLALAVLAAGVGLNVYGMQHALALADVKRVEIALPQLPEGLEGFTVAQISDLHVSLLFRSDRVAAMAAKVNALHPDLIAVTGDFVDGELADRAADLEPLKTLEAPYGVWGCEGNHEHYVDYPGWRRHLATLGITMLYNEHGVVNVKGTPLVIAGLTDYIAEKFHDEVPNLAAALSGAPEAFTLLLAHQPKLAPKVAGRGVDLQLAGHTHGGQLPGVTLVTKVLNSGFLAGLYEVPPVKAGGRSLALYVNSGTQLWNGFANRIGTTGEITLITLRRAKAN